MNKSFILLDRNNNLQKNANVIVKFDYEGKDYLIYSIEENEQNSQIFVSRLVKNSEGKIFIDNILAEEKNNLNNIVYNIVILVPSEAQKGILFNDLCNNLFNKFGVKLSLFNDVLEMQEYFSNCSVAITSKILVDAATKLYDSNLVQDNASDGDVLVPTWTAPATVTAPVPTDVVEPEKVSEPSAAILPPEEPVVVPEVNVHEVVTAPQEVLNNPVLEPLNVVSTPDVVNINSAENLVDEVVVPATPVNNNASEVLPNPQAEKLAIVSDPSLGINVGQPNVGKNKKAGFANTKYVVIGTVCLVLAVAVVIAAYFLIRNMK